MSAYTNIVSIFAPDSLHLYYRILAATIEKPCRVLDGSFFLSNTIYPAHVSY